MDGGGCLLTGYIQNRCWVNWPTPGRVGEPGQVYITCETISSSEGQRQRHNWLNSSKQRKMHAHPWGTSPGMEMEYLCDQDETS